MVMTLGYLSVLILIAAIIVVVAVSEKRTSHIQYNHGRSFYSADAGGEAAINWLRVQNSPPGILDSNNHVYIPASYDSLGKAGKYKFSITFVGKRNKPGWGLGYKDFDYGIISDGLSAQESESEIGIQARRLFKEGY